MIDLDRFGTLAASGDLATLRAEIATPHSPAALAALHGADLATDAVLLRAALLETPLPQDWRANVARGSATPFPITAADLPHLSGPALGAELKRLKTAWLASDLRLTRSQLLG